MKKAIILIIVSVVKILILAFICNLIYDWNDLNKVFGPAISYSQWIGIIAILNSIVPNGIVNLTKDDK